MRIGDRNVRLQPSNEVQPQGVRLKEGMLESLKLLKLLALPSIFVLGPAWTISALTRANLFDVL